MAHAKLSPSGAHRWMQCPGSVVLEAKYPDTGSTYAREGSAAHELAAIVLEDNEPNAQGYVGMEVEFNDGDEVIRWPVDQSMADHVDDYIRLVRERAAEKMLLVERKLPIGHITGEHGATGTADAVVIDHVNQTIEVIDFKYGMGVKVLADNNEQLQLYALGALEEYAVLGDFKWITMIIHQPRLNHVSEWTIPTKALLEFGDTVRDQADLTRDAEMAAIRANDFLVIEDFLDPGEKQCKWCKAKAGCPALRNEVAEIVGDASAASIEEFSEFKPETVNAETGDNYLPVAMSKVALVEDWCKAVRAEVERRLIAGQPVTGYKLVEGKRGNRKWANEAKVEELLKSFRLRQDEMYDYSLISPTKAEKLFKTNPKRWAKVSDLVTQSEGKPSVALAADKRPELAVQSVADDFRDFVKTAN